MAAPQPVGLVGAGLELGLHAERDLEPGAALAATVGRTAHRAGAVRARGQPRLRAVLEVGGHGWVAEHVAIDRLGELSDDACYRAMDWLLAVEPELAERVYGAVADLLNLEVDLLFFDYPADPEADVATVWV